MKSISKPPSRYKGNFGVTPDGNSLRISLPRELFGNSKRHFYPGLRSNAEGQAMAKGLSADMERDYLNNELDITLNKYRRRKAPIIQPFKSLTLEELHLAYWEAKKPDISPNYEKSGIIAMHSHLIRSPYAQVVPDTDTTGWAQGFFDWAAAAGLSPGIRKRLLQELNRCLHWAISKKLVKLQQSPFEGMAGRIRLHRTKAASNAKPLTQVEVSRLLDWVAEHRRHKHYFRYLSFLFATGCRHGEAQALWFETVAFVHRTVTFDHMIIHAEGGRQRRAGLKSQPYRTLEFNDRVERILLEARKHAVNHIVFPSPKGVEIDGCVFNQIWHTGLAEVGVADREPYQTRHTFASLCAKEGMPPVELAAILGNKPETAINNYVINIGKTFIPELDF